MAGKKFFAPAFAGLFLFFSLALSQEDLDSKIQRHLAVQKALQQGQINLRQGNYLTAVTALESQIQSINGNREYLESLADAYRGYLGELQGPMAAAEGARIQRRLSILEGGMASEASPEKREIKTPLAVKTPVKTPLSSRFPLATKPALVKEISGSKVRAKIEDPPSENLFSHTNSQKYFEASGKLSQAEGEFAKNNFRAAGRFFQEACRLEPRVVEKSLERWAYCRLHAVVEAMNGRPDSHDPAWSNEIRICLAMAPQMQSFGKQLLSTLDQRAPAQTGEIRLAPQVLAPVASGAVGPPVEVHHSGPHSNGFSLAQTKNFRVWHKLTQQEATQMAKAAEAFRAESAMKWFGSVGEDWNPICELFLHTNAQEYAKATGAPAGSPGHSTLRTEGSRVLARRIDLRLDDVNLMLGVLPHETTHVVLAGRLGDQPVPRWADEGMSVLSEPRSRIQRNLDNLPRHAKEGALFPCEKLLKLADYPEPRLVGPFYAQSVAVVDYLVRLKGARVFAEFMRDGLKTGYESALRKHYGIEGFAGLDQRWWPESSLAASGRN